MRRRAGARRRAYLLRRPLLQPVDQRRDSLVISRRIGDWQLLQLKQAI